jgi:hypothetical protein
MKTVIPDFPDRAGKPFKSRSHWMQERSWFGYTSGFRELVLKKSLPPSSLSIVYSLPVDMVLERIRILILNAILLNVAGGYRAVYAGAHVRAEDLYSGRK